MRKLFLCCWAATILAAGIAGAAPPPEPVAAPSPIAPSSASAPSEEARRHMLRGMAAIELAKSNEDLAQAAEEFRQATELAPQMAIAWFNLGKARTQLGRYGEAIDSYRHYLTLAPQAKDAQSVRDEIVKLEFRQELAAKAEARLGGWVGQDGASYQLTANGNRLTLKTDQRPVPQEEVRSTYSLVGNVPVTASSPAEYQLVVQGNRLTGAWSRGAVRADKCMIPPDTAEATGELFDKAGKIVLRHERTSYTAATQMSLLGDDSCGGVTAGARKSVEETFYGPLPKGGLGVVLYGLTSWWDGGFSVVQYGWQGRLGIKVQPGTPAFEAGLRDEDEILAIDGVAVRSLSAGETVFRLRGEPGSRVTLQLRRKGNQEPLTVSLQRVELPSGK